MNVVMVLDNNQNNILPYRSRLLQMPKVEIQGLFNAHITFTIDKKTQKNEKPKRITN